MNIHTFKDAVSSKRNALANELAEDNDEDDDGLVANRIHRKLIDGEEQEGDEKFNEIGEVIEPFNLKDEREGGHFDESLSYVFKKERGEVDAWVANLDEATIEKAIGEAAIALKKRTAQNLINDQEQEERKKSINPLDLKLKLLSILQPGETITKCMRRLTGKQESSGVKRRLMISKPKDRSIKPKTSTTTTFETKNNRKQIELLTDIADDLLSIGVTAIYDITYETLLATTLEWEYMGADGVIYGPYTSLQLAKWRNDGYFTGESAVKIRSTKQSESWQSSDDVDFGQLSHLEMIMGILNQTTIKTSNSDSSPSNQTTTNSRQQKNATSRNSSGVNALNREEEDDDEEEDEEDKVQPRNFLQDDEEDD